MTQTVSKQPEAKPCAADTPTFTRYARLFTVVALGLSSVFLAVSQLIPHEQSLAYLTLNQRPLVERLTAVGVCWGLGILLAVAACFWSRRGPTPQHRQRATMQLFAPCISAAFLPILFVRQAWEGRELAYLVYLLCVGLCLERLLHPALIVVRRRTRNWGFVQHLETTFQGRWGAWLGIFVALSLALYYVLRIGHLTNISHFKFQTSSSDLAEYDNLFFNALSGHPFRAPGVATRMEDWSHLAGHAELALYLLLPFYALAPSASTLLWIQASLVGLTAIPIYLLARARLGVTTGVIFAAAFLMMPVTQQPNFYDFHFTPAAMFFISWLMYLLYRVHQGAGRGVKLAAFVMLLCALSCREDIGIGTAVIGIFLVLHGRLVREGLVITAVSGAYFISMKFGIMPLFGSWWFDDMYGDLKSEGIGGFGSIIVTLLSNQAFVLRSIINEPKALYLLHMTVPVLALWLRKPLLLLAVIPAMISSLLVTSRPPLFQPSFQYTYLWLPYVIGASILALNSKRKGATLLAILIVAVSLDVQKGLLLGGTRIMGGFSPKDLTVSSADHLRMKQFKKITAQLPRTAAVSVTEHEGPHVSARMNMFSLKFSLGVDPDYLLVGPIGIRGEEAHVREALESGRYGVIATEGPFTLIQKGATTAKNGPLLRRVHGKSSRRSRAKRD